MGDNQSLPQLSTKVNPEEQGQALLDFIPQNERLETTIQKQDVENRIQNKPAEVNLEIDSEKILDVNQNKELTQEQKGKTQAPEKLLAESAQKSRKDNQEKYQPELQDKSLKENQSGIEIQKIQNSEIINIFMGQQVVESSLIQKNEDREKSIDETPFLWGEEEKQGHQNDKTKRSFSQFFIHSKLAKSQELFDSMKIESTQLKKIGKMNLKSSYADQNVDIWSDLRKSMKSRIEQRDGLKKEKKNSNFKEQVKKKSQKLQEIPQKTPKKSMVKIGRSQQKNGEVMNSIDNMNKVILEKVKKWKTEQKKIDDRRKEQINIFMEKIKEEQSKQQKELAIKKLQEKKKRAKAITQRQQKKLKRKNASTSPQNNNYGEKDKQRLRKEKVKIVKSKTEKNYDKQINNKSLLEDKKQPNQSEMFSMHWNIKDQNVIEDRQKLLRRKIFQQKVRQIPVNVSQSKKLKLLIEIDKSANPLKYNFMSKKGLEDEDIYRNHKQFKLPESSKKIGIKYLQDIRQKNKIDDLRRYMSQQSIANIKKYERNWKSPVLEAPQVKQKFTLKFWKDDQKSLKLHEEDNNYLRALKK